MREDFNSEVSAFDLVKAAHRYQPGTASWSHYAYVAISLDTRRSVDDAGVRLGKKVTNEDGVRVLPPPAAAPSTTKSSSHRPANAGRAQLEEILQQDRGPARPSRSSTPLSSSRASAAVTLASQGPSPVRRLAAEGVSAAPATEPYAPDWCTTFASSWPQRRRRQVNDLLARAQQALHRTPPITTQTTSASALTQEGIETMTHDITSDPSPVAAEDAPPTDLPS